jgi:hypothetical protein
MTKNICWPWKVTSGDKFAVKSDCDDTNNKPMQDYHMHIEYDVFCNPIQDASFPPCCICSPDKKLWLLKSLISAYGYGERCSEWLVQKQVFHVVWQEEAGCRDEATLHQGFLEWLLKCVRTENCQVLARILNKIMVTCPIWYVNLGWMQWVSLENWLIA